MTDHAPFLDLAAMAVGWGLDEAEHHELDAHLRTCSSCRAASAAYERDELVLRDAIAPRALAGDVRANVARAATVRPASRWTLLVAAALLSLGLVGWALLQAGGRSTPIDRLAIAGTWTTTHCATWEKPTASGVIVDCARWGDRSTLTLVIGGALRPVASLADTSGGRCTSADPGVHTPTTHPEFGSAGLFLRLDFPACTAAAIAVGGLDIYHDPGSDSLWDDPDGDGWGHLWHRAP